MGVARGASIGDSRVLETDMSHSEKDSLGDRMKGYEVACRAILPRRVPLILRVDGKAFHTFTRGLTEPFDADFCQTMDDAAVALCKEVQGAQIAFVQSDEISILIHNYKRLNSEAWFDNQVQKMVSVAASVAATTVSLRYGRTALFDARVFLLSEAEVCNAFIWRQQDATRNSIQMLARTLYSHRECHLKNQSDLQEMCWQAGHNWNDLPVWQRRGRFVLRGPDGHWLVDREPPVLTQNRSYIEKHLAVEAED